MRATIILLLRVKLHYLNKRIASTEIK